MLRYERMDGVDLLEHDHDVLGSQVKHVTALLNGLLSKTFSASRLHGELLRQSTSLADQLTAHFGCEESDAFPFLSELLPEYGSGLEQLAYAHRFIRGALDQMIGLLRSMAPNDLSRRLPEVVETYERFHVAFLVHLQEEADLLRKASDKLTDQQRYIISRQLSGR